MKAYLSYLKVVVQYGVCIYMHVESKSFDKAVYEWCFAGSVFRFNQTRISVVLLFPDIIRSDRGRDQQDLSMMLKGTVDAKVNGGIMLYQKAFLTAEYFTENSEHAEYIDKLKQSIQYHVSHSIRVNLGIMFEVFCRIVHYV